MELVKKCNEGRLDPIHLYDVTEDFIGQKMLVKKQM
jgi:hypothetical protein